MKMILKFLIFPLFVVGLFMFSFYKKNKNVSIPEMLTNDGINFSFSVVEFEGIINDLRYYLTHNPNGHINDILDVLRYIRTFDNYGYVYDNFGDVYVFKFFNKYGFASFYSFLGNKTNITNAFLKVLRPENKKRFLLITENFEL